RVLALHLFPALPLAQRTAMGLSPSTLEPGQCVRAGRYKNALHRCVSQPTPASWDLAPPRRGRLSQAPHFHTEPRPWRQGTREWFLRAWHTCAHAIALPAGRDSHRDPTGGDRDRLRLMSFVRKP